MNGDLTDWFDTVVGAFQGCVLSSLLHCISMEATIVIASEGLEPGTVIEGDMTTNLHGSPMTAPYNAAARLDTGLGRRKLQCWPVRQRVQFNLSSLIHRSLVGTAPDCTCPSVRGVSTHFICWSALSAIECALSSTHQLRGSQFRHCRS